MRFVKSAMSIALLGLIVSPVWADDDKPKDRPPRDGEHKQRMLEKFDKDGDGELNEEERHAAHEARRDKEGPRGGRGHGDHHRGEGRRGAGGPEGPPFGGGRRGPGRPDGPPGPPDGPPPGGPPRPPMDPEKMFQRLDEDGDGQLSLDEFKEGMKRMRPPGPPPRFREGDRGPGGPDGPRFRRGGPDGGPRDGGRPEGRRPGRPPRPEGDSDRPEPESDDEPA